MNRQKQLRWRLQLTTPENTITYHNALCLSPQILRKHCFSFSKGHFNSQEKLKTMHMQYFGVTNKEHYGMLWYFLEWSLGHRVFSHDVTAAILVSQTSPVGVGLFSYANVFFCSNKFA